MAKNKLIEWLCILRLQVRKHLKSSVCLEHENMKITLWTLGTSKESDESDKPVNSVAHCRQWVNFSQPLFAEFLQT